MIDCNNELKSKYSFYCVNGLCPFGRDFYRECLPYMEESIFDMWVELMELRSEVITKAVKHRYEKAHMV